MCKLMQHAPILAVGPTQRFIRYADGSLEIITETEWGIITDLRELGETVKANHTELARAIVGLVSIAEPVEWEKGEQR